MAEFAALIGPVAGGCLETLAQRALDMTRRRFGRTISLYAPLYLSNHCSGGCVYCGFAADRRQVRMKLEPDQIEAELAGLKRMGLDEVLLLTGERTPKVDFDYLVSAVSMASRDFSNVSVEAFAMTDKEYAQLVDAGCTGVTLYQETYDPDLYSEVHRWGEKRNYDDRIDAPRRALAAGIRVVGIGALLGLGEPMADAVAVLQHVEALRKEFWRGGVSVSFPRIRPQQGDFAPRHTVTTRVLAQLIFAFRLCLPDTPLVLSTRESPPFRDGMAGVGISKMSVASRTTVGGYTRSDRDAEEPAQFTIDDDRSVDTFCAMLQTKGLEPVFKNWDPVYRGR